MLLLRRKYRRRAARGQALVIFALSLTAMLALVGLSIDGLRVYIAFGQAQRAAEAAALAGVVYLPAYATMAEPAPDGNDARDRALQEAAKNGFGDASAITLTPAAGPPATLTVRIHINIALTLVALLNPAPASGDAVATAAMLPPITLGDASGAFDDASGQGQLAALVGPNELKEQGDPYSVLCEDGWSQASDATHADATTTSYTTRLGTATNAPQYPTGPNCSPGTPGNPDTIPAGFGGLLANAGSATGNSFLVTLPPGNANYSVWVWNPRFAYGDAGQHSRFFTGENVIHSGMMDDPTLYPQIAYSLYAVPMLYDRAADIPLAAIWPSRTSAPDTSPNVPLPASQIYRDPAVDAGAGNSCAGGQSWSVDGACIATPDDIDNWVQMPSAALMVASSNAPTYYRLTASSTIGAASGYGVHEYAVKVCQNPAPSATTCDVAGATLASWNSATVSLHSAALSTTYPLADIPATYAGRSVALTLFNPGVGQGDVALRIVPPAGGGVITYPAYLRLATNAGTTVTQTAVAGDNLYHGKWIDLTLTLPPDYVGGQWQLQWISDTAGPDTTMTIAASLLGKPVSLLP